VPAASNNVVISTEDLSAIGREIGGDHITTNPSRRAIRPQFVEPKPSFLLKLQKADLLAVVGLQLEIGWLPPLITQSGNSKIQVGAKGYFNLSDACEILEHPTGTVTRADGDVHPLGNPHYWLDPENGRRIARGFKDKLSEMQPADAAFFDRTKGLNSALLTENAGMQAPTAGR
jgi:zinc/manganese transport system substrate-binding protein